MNPDVPDPAERDALQAQDVVLAALVGEYAERRESARTPCVLDLLARAAEFGPEAETKLRMVLAFYEAMRAAELEQPDSC